MFQENGSLLKTAAISLAVLAFIVGLVGVVTPGWYIYEGNLISYEMKMLMTSSATFQGTLKRTERQAIDEIPGKSPSEEGTLGNHRLPGNAKPGTPTHKPPNAANRGDVSGTTAGDLIQSGNVNRAKLGKGTSEPAVFTTRKRTYPSPTSPRAKPQEFVPVKNKQTTPRTWNRIPEGLKQTRAPLNFTLRPINLTDGLVKPPFLPGSKPSNQIGRTGSPPRLFINGSETAGGKLTSLVPRPTRIPASDSGSENPSQVPNLSGVKGKHTDFMDALKKLMGGNFSDAIDKIDYSVHLGLWYGSICNKSGDSESCDGESLSILFGKLRTPDVSLSTWNDLRLESSVSLVCRLLGVIGVIWTVTSPCLKNKQKIPITIAVLGMLISCVLSIVAISRIASIHAQVNEILENQHQSNSLHVGANLPTKPYHLNTPWSVVLCGIGACLAFITILTLGLFVWRSERITWYKFNTDEDLSKDDKNKETYTDITADFSRENNSFEPTMANSKV